MDTRQAIYQGVRETQKITGLPRDMLYKWLKEDKIKHFKSGKRFLVHVPALIAQLENNEVN